MIDQSEFNRRAADIERLVDALDEAKFGSMDIATALLAHIALSLNDLTRAAYVAVAMNTIDKSLNRS